MATLRTSVLALASLLLISRTSSADPTERSDRSRLIHMTPVVLGAALYLSLEIAFKDRVSPIDCRWCEPNRFDTRVRDVLLWDRVKTADSLSNLTGYVGNPLLATGLLVLTTADEPDLRRWFDDTIPVFQAGIATGLLNQAVKIIAGRQRPFVFFKGTAIRAKIDSHTSFFSGHTALAFAMATSSGTVASIRGYRTAPYLWGGGLALAFATGYLRIAADAHHTTDVLTGMVIGGSIGVLIPLLLHRDVLTDDAAPVPRRASQAPDKPFILSLGGSF